MIGNIVSDDANIIFGTSVDETYADEIAGETQRSATPNPTPHTTPRPTQARASHSPTPHIAPRPTQPHAPHNPKPHTIASPTQLNALSQGRPPCLIVAAHDPPAVTVVATSFEVPQNPSAAVSQQRAPAPQGEEVTYGGFRVAAPPPSAPPAAPPRPRKFWSRF